MSRAKGLLATVALLAAFALHLTPAAADDLVKVALEKTTHKAIHANDPKDE